MTRRSRPKLIVFVWDGLRPDSVNERSTPNLQRLRDREGVDFRDHHSVYPTFTMMNAAAFATGAYPGHHGFFGNTEYEPGPAGKGGDGKELDFSQPIFTEDHGVLIALDRFYRDQGRAGLFAVGTLFEAAHAAGLKTAAIGKIGPAFLQDMHPDPERSAILDENIAAPHAFAQALLRSQLPLPVNTVRFPYAEGRAIALAPNNGSPTAIASERQVRLKDGVTPDPRATRGSPHDPANAYLMSVYLEYVLPKFEPDLSFVWLRNPDSTEHAFGPGSPNYLDALANQDRLLGQLLAKLGELEQLDATDLIVVSDHGHSTVAGDPKLFPPRALIGEPDGHGEVGAPVADGYPVSGEIRSADLLYRAGFRHVYDGGGCVLDPVLSGIRRDGSLVYPTRRDTAGNCATKPAVGATAKKQAITFEYSMPSYRVPEALPKDALVIAANGGSEYFYVLDHSALQVKKLVRVLQEQRAYGPIFVRSDYGALPGTLPLSAIFAEAEPVRSPTPDLVVSFDWDDSAVVGANADVPGTEYASAQRYRGMHGSFSPRDVHNTMIARGPDFKAGFVDSLPTGNVDLAPTIAELLGFSFAAPDGRVLREALSADPSSYRVEAATQASAPLRLRRSCGPDDPSCLRPGPPAAYVAELLKKVLTEPPAQRRFTYLEHARVTR